MRKVTKSLTKAWLWFKVLAITDSWKIIFPLFALLIVAVFTLNLIAIGCFLIWFATFIANTNED